MYYVGNIMLPGLHFLTFNIFTELGWVNRKNTFVNCDLTFTFIHFADSFVQSDIQMRF